MKRAGLFVGIDKYKNGITSLNYAVSDANDLTIEFARAQFDTVKFLFNDDAHCDTILDNVETMISRLQPGDLFVFYFAGHGREFGNTHYLLGPTARASTEFYQRGSLSIPELIAVSNKKGIYRLFILDCCRSNILADRSGQYRCGAARDISLNAAISFNVDPHIIQPLIISSCSQGEQAFENFSTGHSYFTDVLISLIKNKNIRSFQQFQNALNVVGTPMPQTVCWNGNVSLWNKIPLFENWRSVPGKSVIEEPVYEQKQPVVQYDIKWYRKSSQKNDEAKIELYKAAAEQGNMIAQCNLGYCYSLGYGVKEDYKKAGKWYAKAIKKLIDLANHNDADAQFHLGFCYESGFYELYPLIRGHETAIEWFKKSAERGCSLAQEKLANYYDLGLYVKKDPRKSFELYKAAAEQGSPLGQLRLAYCYSLGKYVNKDPKKAFELFKASAEQGNAFAQNALGDCYMMGDGVKQDMKKAFKLYKASAEQGNAFAQNALGDCYMMGNGVKQDMKKAFELFKASAEQGDAIAQLRLGFYFKDQL